MILPASTATFSGWNGEVRELFHLRLQTIGSQAFQARQ